MLPVTRAADDRSPAAVLGKLNASIRSAAAADAVRLGLVGVV
jgi:hypothetical protein